MKPYITKLTSNGLKLGDFSHDLTRVNLFVGKSASGKTTRIEALRLALLGRIPELGKQKSATLQLARAGEIQITIADNTGRYRSRTFSDGPVKSVGNLPDAPEVLLDPNVYFNLSDEKKIEYAFSLVQVETTESAKALLFPVERFANEPLQNLITRSIECLKGKLSDGKKQADRLSKSVQVNVQFQGQPPPNPESEFKATRIKQQDVKIRIARLGDELTKLMNADAEIETITQSLLADDSNRVKEAESNIAELNKQIEALQVQTSTEELDKIDSTRIAVERKLAALPSSQVGHFKHWIDKDLETIHALNQRDEALAAHWHSTRKKLLEALQNRVCQTCGGPLTEKKITDEFDRALSSIVKEREQVQADARKVADEVASLRIKLEHAQSVENDREKIQIQINESIGRFNNASRAWKELEETRKTKLKAANLSLQAFTRTLSAAHQVQAKRGQMEARKAELEKLLAERPIDQVNAEIKQVETEGVMIGSQLLILEAQSKNYAQYKADEARNSQTLLQTIQVKQEIERLNQQVESFESVRAEMIGTAMGGLLGLANKFTESVMTPISYRNGEIGRIEPLVLRKVVRNDGEVWIPHAAFSGTEKALTYAGISAALAKDAPIHIVLLDEMGRFDPETVQAVLKTMVELTNSGEIGQFVGCISWPTDKLDMELFNQIFKLPEGVNVIEV